MDATVPISSSLTSMLRRMIPPFVREERTTTTPFFSGAFDGFESWRCHVSVAYTGNHQPFGAVLNGSINQVG